jgi:hypothetical protein
MAVSVLTSVIITGGNTVNKVEPVSVADDQIVEISKLPPAQRLELGSIVTIRMRGHSRSPGGLEYFAPAVVLDQYNDDYGSIDALVWDSSAGNSYAHGYHVRELGVRGEGSTRETYELQSNIGEVLFSPHEFSLALLAIGSLQNRVNTLESAMRAQRSDIKSSAANEAMPSSLTSAPKGAEKQK